MPKIFISYRRQDSQDITMRVRDRLTGHFGADSIFIDIDSVPLGADFLERITGEVAHCDALIAVVGPHWMGTRYQPAEYVRIEIEAALDKNIPVIPVLVGGAVMPSPSELPETLRRFAFRNAAVIDSGINFTADTDRLVRALEQNFDDHGSASKEPSSVEARHIKSIRRMNSRTMSFVAVGILVFLVIGVTFVLRNANNQSISERPNQQNPTEANSKLLVAPFGTDRIRPLDGYPVLRASPAVFAEGARISLGLSHNLSGSEKIIIRRVTPLLHYTAGSNANMSYEIPSRGIAGAGVADPRRFIIRLYGSREPMVVWITGNGRQPAKPDNILEVDPPKLLYLDTTDSAEELDITIIAMENGTYELGFEIGYTIGAVDHKLTTESLRIYRR